MTVYFPLEEGSIAYIHAAIIPGPDEAPLQCVITEVVYGKLINAINGEILSKSKIYFSLILSVNHFLHCINVNNF